MSTATLERQTTTRPTLVVTADGGIQPASIPTNVGTGLGPTHTIARGNPGAPIIERPDVDAIRERTLG